MKTKTMRIFAGDTDVAIVESPATKASALDAMAREDGYEDFTALCHDRGWTHEKGWNLYEAEQVPEKHRIELPTGTLDLDVLDHDEEWPLERLSDFGARRNPKRGFLVVSKILGRHIPASPSDLREAMNTLAEKLPRSLPGPVLVIGMAETATALGQGVHAGYVRRTGRDDVWYVQSTRQTDGRAPLLSFEEAHSHATSHLILAPRSQTMADVYRTARSVVIVDDECSTGNTFIESATALLAIMPKVERIETAVLTDWSGGGYVKRMPRPTSRHYLLTGKLSWTPDAAAVAAASLVATTNGHGRTPEHGTPARYGIQNPDEGEFRIDEIGRVIEDRRVLVLGECEFTYAALLLGERLQSHGNDVRIQAITRSPVMEGGAIQDTSTFDDPYGSGAPCFLYNALTPVYDDVVVVTEIPGSDSDVRMLEQLEGDNRTRVFPVFHHWE